MDDFRAATQKLDGRTSRKLANNTYLQVRDENTIALKLHNTDILTFHADGKVRYFAGTWRTVTTKARMNEFGPLRVSQSRGQWYVLPPYSVNPSWDGSLLFQDGCGWDSKRKRVIGAAKIASKKGKAELKLRKDVAKYVKGFMEALKAGEVPEPGAGDCFYCQMRTQNGETLGEATKDHSHLLSHFEEKYYVPSLIMRAFEAMGAAPVQFWGLGSFWGKGETPATMEQYATDSRSQSMFRRYLYRQLGLVDR